MNNEHQTRLWQMRPDALQYIHAKQAAKLSGLDPDTLDDMWTEYFAEAMGVDAEPIEYTDDGIAIVSVVGPLYKRKSPFVSNYKSIAEALDELLEMEEDRPSACVLKIDSPGGQVAGLEEVCRKVSQLSEMMLVLHPSTAWAQARPIVLPRKPDPFGQQPTAKSDPSAHIGNSST